MICLVTILAQSNQIARSVAAGLSAFDVMNIQYGSFAPRFAVASMTIPEENVLADIPESKLITLLVCLTFDFGISDLLNVEGGDFNDGITDWQYLVDKIHYFNVSIDLVLDAWCKPTLILRLNPVQESGFTITSLSASPRPSILSACREQINYIGSQVNFRLEQDVLLGCSRQADSFTACIYA